MLGINANSPNRGAAGAACKLLRASRVCLCLIRLGRRAVDHQSCDNGAAVAAKTLCPPLALSIFKEGTNIYRAERNIYICFLGFFF